MIKIKNVSELHDRIIVAIAKLCDAGLITRLEMVRLQMQKRLKQSGSDVLCLIGN